jgi:hypothetical protein
MAPTMLTGTKARSLISVVKSGPLWPNNCQPMKASASTPSAAVAHPPGSRNQSRTKAKGRARG